MKELYSKELVSWMLLVFAACCDCFTLYVIRWRSLTVGSFDATSLKEALAYCQLFLSHPLVWLGAITFGIGLPLGYVVVTRLPVTVFYPVNVSLHLFLSAIIGFYFLNEGVSLQKVAGITFLFLGILLTTTSK